MDGQETTNLQSEASARAELVQRVKALVNDIRAECYSNGRTNEEFTRGRERAKRCAATLFQFMLGEYPTDDELAEVFAS